jgi:hypothetical protein
MKELSFEQMEKVQGGISLSCGLALAATGISVATFLLTPYAALPILLWGGGHLIATASVVDSCMR